MIKLTPPNLLDRAIAVVAPATAARRLAWRSRYELMASAGGYKGAARDRRGTENWRTSGGSPDADLLPDREQLVERSRDLERNAPIAAGAISTLVTNVVGTGLKPTPSIDRVALNLAEEAADAWERRAASIFSAWADSTDCDATGEQCFAELQEMVFRSALVSGDVLLVKRFMEAATPSPYSPFGYRLQAVEADRLSNPSGVTDGSQIPQGQPGSGNIVSAGVERDRDGRTVAYHISDAHPGALRGTIARIWGRYPAISPTGRRLVLHVYKRLRPDQSRGVPYLAPVIEAIKEIDRYAEAERMRAVVSALFTAFIKTESGAGIDSTPTAEISGAAVSDKGLKLPSGTVFEMARGDEMVFANPTAPNPAFEGFVGAFATYIGAALELPQELMLKRFASSYSASRAALLEAWKFFRARRAWLAGRVCQPAYEDVLTEAIARGMLNAPGFFDDPMIRRAWLAARWVGPAPGQLDPMKEAQAAKLLIDEELSTRQEQTAAITGGDWEENHQQRAKEERARRADGLMPAAPSQASPARPAPAEDPDERRPDDPRPDELSPDGYDQDDDEREAA